MKRWLLLIIAGWVIFLGMHTTTKANEPVSNEESAPTISTAWWRDSSSAAELKDMANKPFKIFQHSISLGNSADTVWVRINLPSLTGKNGTWVLLMQPAMIQEAEVFIENHESGVWDTQILGLAHSFSSRPLSLLNLAYPLTASSKPRIAYIRLKTVTSAFQVQIKPAEAAHSLDASMHAGIGVYAGLTLAFTVLSLVCLVLTRDVLWGFIALFDATTLLLTIVQMGLASRYLVPESEGLMNHILVIVNCSNVAVAMFLSYHLARRFSSHRWISWPYIIVLIIYPIEILLIWQGKEATALSAANISVIFISIWSFIASWKFDVYDRVLRWICRGLYWLLGIYLLYYLTPLVVKIPPPAALHFYPALPSNFITMTFAAVMLMRATQQARVTRIEERRRFLAEHELKQSRKQHEETSGLLSMLLHEIRTPLALIQTATRALTSGRASDATGLKKMTQRIDDAVINISNVLERCIEVDGLEHNQLSVHPRQLDAAAVLREWLNKRPIAQRVQLNTPSKLPACVDAQLWLSMVKNVLENAEKYSPADSLIIIELQQDNQNLIFKVTNQVGKCGLPDADRLFQKYYRSDHASHISGTGLGLYWVKVASQRIGGDICYIPPVSNLGDTFVVFRLTLPRDSATVPAGPSQTSSATP